MARGATSILHHAKSVRRQPTFSPLDKSRRVFLFAFLSLVVLASACAIFYIGTHIQAVNLGYKIGQELQRKEGLIEDNKRLSLEIARLKSPTRIEAEAKATLGLELPKTQQVFYLSRWEPDTLVKVAGAAPLPTADKEIAAKPAAKDPTPAKIAAAPETKSKPAAVKTAGAPAQKPAEHPKLAKAETTTKATAVKPPAAAKPSAASEKTVTEKIAKLEKSPPARPLAKTPEAKPAVKTAAVETNPPQKKSVVAKSDPTAKPEPVVAAKTPAKAPIAKEPAAGKALEAAAKTPAATVAKKPETPKQESAKIPTTKSSAKQNPQESRVAKRDTSNILVAKIVDKETSREKMPNKLKSGPSLAYQPKDKVPAVMLDPMP